MMGWWQKRRWINSNPARDMRMPKEPAGTERLPYSAKDIQAILAACDRAGNHAYERLRWRAMILLMRFYGLRVSDVATLERDRLNEYRIAVRAIKNKRWLWMPLYPEVADALKAVPPPSGLDNKYFFWSERGSREIHINNTIMSLAAVYRESGVPGATSHRFRHTLAMELLAKGASIEQVADILGDSPATVRKHYKHWMPEYQRATAELLDRVHRGRNARGRKSTRGTYPAHEENRHEK
jgi:integrase